MSQIDIVKSSLFKHNDVFADITNAYVFQGRQIVKPEDLEDASSFIQFNGDDDVIYDKEGMITKFWKEGNLFFTLAIVNEAQKIMPVKALIHDGELFNQQLSRNPDSIHAVLTIVVYLGKTHWNYDLNIEDAVYIPEYIEDDVKAVMNHYEINSLFEVSFLTEEQVNMFKSDFKVVADYLVQMRENKEYKPSDHVIHHVDEVLMLMKELILENTGQKFIDELKAKGEPITMVSAYREVMERTRSEGRNEGRISVYYQDMKMSPETISGKVNEPLEVVNKVIQSLKK